MFNIDNFLNCYLKSASKLNLYIDPKLNSIYEFNQNNFHLTASGIVIRDDSVLLIFHRYIKEWFQPGGHIDEGELPHIAAQREVLEETGWHTALLGDEIPVDIDIHLIPANPIKSEPEHWHIDCAFLFNPIKQSTPTDPEVSKWFEFGEVTNQRIKRVLNFVAKN
jgi:8-oxo-dGTP pyrophosphatase MutT (NUDIX family)